jgi:prepilin-type N-terminal cleavage/methylation domain-containing protein
MKYKKLNLRGFTIIETMIVISIVGLIMVVLFIAVPELQRNERDHQRKEYANRVFQAMEEYYKNNGHFVNPDSPNHEDEKFLLSYMPEGKDPTVGKSYAAKDDSEIDYFSGGTGTKNRATVIYYSGIRHDFILQKGQIAIAMGHVCYVSEADSYRGAPGRTLYISDAEYHRKHIYDMFAVVVYQEHGGYFCLDDFQGNRSAAP